MPVDLFSRLSGVNFWRKPELNPRGMTIIQATLDVCAKSLSQARLIDHKDNKDRLNEHDARASNGLPRSKAAIHWQGDT
jgi:hypothetical protein